jgi:K+-sensing histidine kinase KdpD
MADMPSLHYPARYQLGAITAGPYKRAMLESLVEIQERTAEQVSQATPLSPLEAADREDELTDWLDDHGIAGGRQLAPHFVQAGLGTDRLDQDAAAVDEHTLEGAVRRLNHTVETELLMNGIEDSTTRVSQLVDAAKQYSQLDRAPYQTNLIDNAVAAIGEAGGDGTLTVRTALVHRDRLLVEFRDTGPGIPADIRGRIFDPFFTTKPVGRGTWLGLDISWRIIVNKHHGHIEVHSAPATPASRSSCP